MANQDDIKKYLIKGEKPYLFNEDNNGKILMLSGVWGSGKTHFWKEDIEEELIKNIGEKSYVFISLYGKDSIEELQTEIQQLSYNFSKEDSKNIISSTFSVFTKVASFMPKISFEAYGFGVELDATNTTGKLEEENIKQQIKQGVGRLKDGGIICFDDFERKSSKIDLNDLFGFITNLTEVFNTKTVIITNQEFFQENDSEVFGRIKEKSVNKFLLLNPTVEELFDTIYKDKHSVLDEYKDKILEAIKITEEKNARIFIQVLDNCLEYKESAKNEHEIFMLVLITVLFVKYNLVFKMSILSIKKSSSNNFNSPNNSKNEYLPSIYQDIPEALRNRILNVNPINDREASFFDKLHNYDELVNNKKIEEYIKENKNMLFQSYKYCIQRRYFEEKDNDLIKKLNNFVESGILLENNV